MTLTLGVPVGPTAAAVAYLEGELAQRGNPLPIGVTPPPGRPTSYALLSRSGQHQRNPFVVDYMIRVRCFDADAEQCERNADLLWTLMRAVGHRKITTSQGAVWISSATPGDSGPALLDDLDVPLFGLQFGMFWTIALKPT
ncbi:hypothetical protein FK529_05485 [Tsukamurella asaccharolytica]|uniref:DUF3168 domain-containing protein n=1 Tax=Tsukamurella asaccharolytica TaxID=2592067 RepID=A0A5C5RCM3_9ACTN|nr:hypothetical protein [Tsukamurella asaccharolytica]TWS20779.1 hypothetical protein FK529_05485 [Tsukamurella asaccharolytica]